MGSETDGYTVGGIVTGLTDSGLVLQNNGGDDFVVTDNGAFVFPSVLEDGVTYDVTVAADPPSPTRAVTSTGATAGRPPPTSPTVEAATMAPMSPLAGRWAFSTPK